MYLIIELKSIVCLFVTSIFVWVVYEYGIKRVEVGQKNYLFVSQIHISLKAELYIMLIQHGETEVSSAFLLMPLTCCGPESSGRWVTEQASGHIRDS